MTRWRSALPFLCLAALLPGCEERSRDPAALAAALPPDLTLDTVIEASDTPGKGKTVADALAEVGAYRGADGKLHDRGGREITFYKVQSRWWGNPPANYGEVQERERRELEQLRQRSTVIEVGPPYRPL